MTEEESIVTISSTAQMIKELSYEEIEEYLKC